jgi:hypothetical protein
LAGQQDHPTFAAGAWQCRGRVTPIMLSCVTSPASVAEFSRWLKVVARHVDLGRYKKHPRGPKKKQDKPLYDPKNPHLATIRELKSRKVANKWSC